MMGPESLTYSVNLADRNTSQKHFETLGFNEKFEIRRRDQLVRKFGHTGLEIYSHEHNRLVNSYKREFIDDIPFSQANVYWFDGDVMRTFPKNDSTFSMNIDKRERDGLTLYGWNKMQEVVGNTLFDIRDSRLEDQVVIWYSPSGQAGSEPPFNKINFESGRMYVGIVRRDGFVINFDCKLHENTFDILSVLNTLQRNRDKKNSVKEFLTDPFSTQLTSQDFFALVSSLPQSYHCAYTSQMHDNPQPISFVSIMDGVEQELIGSHTENEIASMKRLLKKLDDVNYDYIGDKSTQTMEATWITYCDPAQDYLNILHYAAQKNGGKVMLYGCSANKVIDDPLGLENTIITNIGRSIFDTQRRTTASSLFSKKQEKKWDYHEGFCSVCDPNKEKKTDVGPCNICKICEKKFDNMGNFSLN